MKKTTLLLAASGWFGFNGVAVAEEEAGPQDAAANWRQHCQRCHGADGSGKTRIGQRMKLLDYTDAAVQATFSDEEIIKVIRDGVTDERGREVKPSYADVMTDAEIKEMVGYIRAMAKTE